MKEMKRLLLCMLAAGLCLLAACGGEPAESELPTESASQTQMELPDVTLSQTPEESESARQESADPAATEDPGEEPSFSVDGVEIPGETYTSPTGYTVFCPETVTVNAWDGGETFLVNDADGTYLAVSRLDAPGMSTAVAALQFEYAIEGEPTGCLFGVKGYAGQKMTMSMEGLYVEFILCEEGGTIYLLELALYEGGTEQESLLRAMLDTVAFQ